jgi:phosphoglycerate dehydrogenase-like enzyme
MFEGMAKPSVSRRSFLAAAGAGGAAQVVVAQAPYPVSTVRAQGNPIRIVTYRDLEAAEVAKIRAAAPHVEVVVCASESEFRDKVRDAEVIIGEPQADVLAIAPKLKWVQVSGAGVEWMDQALRSSPVVVTNCARTFAPGITETGMGLLLCLTRGISTYYMPQFYKHQMQPVGNPRSADHIELAGKTMGIVGMGGIGSTLARRAHYGFEMRVVATDAKPLPKPEYVAELHDPGWFPEMAKQVDVLVGAAPHTPQTERMFSESVFRSMKKGSYFLALSRGKLFDDMALVKALREGWIAGAGLDVFPVEPPPPAHPIFELSNVVMTPHTSGWSPDRQVRLVDLYAENVRRYAIGEPLLNLVDKQRGY